MRTEQPLRVGFLHVGRERSGLRRYGGILATGTTTHAVTDGTGRARRLPPEVFSWILGERDEAPATLA